MRKLYIGNYCTSQLCIGYVAVHKVFAKCSSRCLQINFQKNKIAVLFQIALLSDEI